MSVIFIALAVTLLIAAGFVVAFVLAVKRGQFEDLDTPAYRILFDDEPMSTPDHNDTDADHHDAAKP